MLPSSLRNLAYTPLDIPRIEPDSWTKFWDIWKEKTQPVLRVQSDRGGNANTSVKDGVPWLGMQCYLNPNMKHNFAWDYGQYHDFSREFPNMWANIQQLPYKEISSISLVSSRIEIHPHHDGGGNLDFPFQVRIMLWDENPKPTFYLHKTTKELRASGATVSSSKCHHMPRLYMNVPYEHNAFAYNNESCVHASDYDQQHHKILAMVRGVIDKDKYYQLLENSAKKFLTVAHWIENPCYE